LSSLLLVGPNTWSSPAPAQLPSRPLAGPPKNESSVPAGMGAEVARRITRPTSPPAMPTQSSPKPSPAGRFPSIPKPAIVPVTAAGIVPGGQAVAATAGATQAPSAPTATLNHSPRAHARALLRLADMLHLTEWREREGRTGASTPEGGRADVSRRLGIGIVEPAGSRSFVRGSGRNPVGAIRASTT